MTFLPYSKPFREFYAFTKFPDAFQIMRFKQDFLNILQLVSDNLVGVAKTICKAVNYGKADIGKRRKRTDCRISYIPIKLCEFPSKDLVIDVVYDFGKSRC